MYTVFLYIAVAYTPKYALKCASTQAMANMFTQAFMLLFLEFVNQPRM